ncbi:MAG: DUF4395 family protein [Propionibacteriales bacterium]|nr:DUF4395 family protein [Propionibacteriales bacterium]
MPASEPTPAAQVDPRGLRFAAALTAVVLAAVLVTGSTWLLAAQAAVFAIGAFAGVRRSPYGLVFTHLVRPRLAPPAEREDPRPPQFAQAVGLGFALLGLVGFLAGATTLGLVATGAAFAAALLNAAFGFCLGCEVYLLFRRTRFARKLGTKLEVSA